MPEEDKILDGLFALFTALPLVFGIYLSTTIQMDTVALITFSMFAGIYTIQIYVAMQAYRLRERLFNITQEKEDEDSEEEDEPEKES